MRSPADLRRGHLSFKSNLSAFDPTSNNTVRQEIWLKTNRRAYGLLAILPAIGVGICALLCLWLAQSQSTLFWLSAVACAGLIAELAWLARQASRPRLAYCEGTLLVYLRGNQPIRVPIDIVECFFLGQGASLLPRPLEGKQGEGAETATVIIRLAESAKEWTHRDVQSSLGHWCEGYITIRGTWCEPLHGDLIASLNQKLIAAHRAMKQNRQPVPA